MGAPKKSDEAPPKVDLRALIARNREEANGLAMRAGGPRLARLLGRASIDLKKRIEQAEGLGGAGADSFTAAQARVTRMQLGLVAKSLGIGLRDHVVANAGEATELGVNQTVDYLQTAERHFMGIGQPLPLRPVEMFDSISQGARASQLRRLVSDGGREAPGILDRYGLAVVGSFEETLQAGLLAKTPWAQVRDQITDDSAFLQGQPRFWAERIVRTESMGAYNRATHAASEEASEEIDDLVRILCATFDDRTGWDSIQVHGQIRKLTEPFVSAFGSYMTPPNRPNDREIVVTHRLAWPLPEHLKPREEAEAQAAWVRQGRKGAMPPRPGPMSTVPLDQFGKAREKKPEEEAAPDQTPELLADPSPAAFTLSPRKGVASLFTSPRNREAFYDKYSPDPQGNIPTERFGMQMPTPADELAIRHIREAPIDDLALAAWSNPRDHVKLDQIIATISKVSTNTVFGEDTMARDALPPTKTDAKGIPVKEPIFVRDGDRYYPLDEQSHGAVAYALAAQANLGASASKNPMVGGRVIDKAALMQMKDARNPISSTSMLRAAAAGDGEELRKATRNHFASVFPTMTSRDAARGMVQHRVSSTLPKNALAVHKWSGAVEISPKMDADWKSSQPKITSALRAGKKPREVFDALSENEGRAIEAHFHEELHGYSPTAANSKSYEGVGVVLEEAGTELLARKATRELFGLSHTEAPEQLRMPTSVWGKGAYTEYLAQINDALHMVLPAAGPMSTSRYPAGAIGDALEKAFVKVRERKEPFANATEHLEAFTKAIEGIPEDKRITLMKHLRAIPVTR